MNSVYSARPIKYSVSSVKLHTTKLDTGRGSRSFTNSVTTGSNRNAMMIAMTIVIRKTRPKYSSAIAAANASTVTARFPGLRSTGTSVVNVAINPRPTKLHHPLYDDNEMGGRAHTTRPHPCARSWQAPDRTRPQRSAGHHGPRSAHLRAHQYP